MKWKNIVKCDTNRKHYELFISLILFFVCDTAGHLHNDKPCGVVASDHAIHQHPWLVVLEYHYKYYSGGIRCAGALITSRHIITAAHCVVLGMFPIIMLPRLGEYNMSSDPDCDGNICADPPVRMVIQKIFVHPGFRKNRKLSGNDLAILMLEAEAPYTDFIRPVCLPSGILDDQTLFYASGFGATPYDVNFSEVKKNIPVPYYPNCWKIYRNIENNLICAGGVKGFDTCSGDSGSPLVRMVKFSKFERRFEIWGVTKGGHSICGSPGVPGLYTCVICYRDWVIKIVDMYETRNDHKNVGLRRNGSIFLVISFVTLTLVFI
ncbi:CLIP domain-containing serine protease B4-like [Plodia interpunctella]|uniref:CLIP domain-containing serine protease B4-like n=1 Tax=Plodia interpunctella TaxID=58824 RepID=UPI0023674B02|nr:CLIP domain-containing serine protease B4-like isoform X2 [Plodia interpunctella]